jgi:hypothetical protein
VSKGRSLGAIVRLEGQPRVERPALALFQVVKELDWLMFAHKIARCCSNSDAMPLALTQGLQAFIPRIFHFPPDF